MSNTRSRVSRVGVGLIVALLFGKSTTLLIFQCKSKEKERKGYPVSTATVLSNEHGH
jgi:hypothetical protein